MTYHRWRKGRAAPRLNGTRQERVAELPLPAAEELREENIRLRQLVTDLSLEKLKLQETIRALKNQ